MGNVSRFLVVASSRATQELKLQLNFIFCRELNHKPRGLRSRIALKTVQNQRQVPRQPVPDVKATVSRYLAALKPLLPDFQYEHNEQLAEEFLAGSATKLNSLLKE